MYPSSTLNRAVNAFATLPGIGNRTALRLVMNLLRRESTDIEAFSEAIHDLADKIHYCSTCHNISETDTCPICADPTRDRHTLCVVSDIQDVMAIEDTGQYKGLYHVLGGVIAPTLGLGPEELQITSLIERVQAGDSIIDEIILALPATTEGDITNFYIFRQLQSHDIVSRVKVTQIARGIAVGNELEYTDGTTLARSLNNRTPFTC